MFQYIHPASFFHSTAKYLYRNWLPIVLNTKILSTDRLQCYYFFNIDKLFYMQKKIKILYLISLSITENLNVLFKNLHVKFHKTNAFYFFQL